MARLRAANSDRHIDIPSLLTDIAKASTEITVKAFGRWGRRSCQGAGTATAAATAPTTTPGVRAAISDRHTEFAKKSESQGPFSIRADTSTQNSDPYTDIANIRAKASGRCK